MIKSTEPARLALGLEKLKCDQSLATLHAMDDRTFRLDAIEVVPVWTAKVDLDPTVTRGDGPTGKRYVVPIVGGSFTGTLAPETAHPIPMKGKIVAGGFDIQRERKDGVLELEAIYHMLTDDGVMLEIRNEAILTLTQNDEIDYSRSRINVEAPIGKYDWLNKRVIVGTVEEIEPEKQVLIRAFVLV